MNPALEQKPSVGVRIGSMLLDHFFLGMSFGIIMMTYQTVTGSITKFELPVVPFYVFIAIYLNKDAIKGQSIAKRLLGLQIVDRKTGQPAKEFQCFLRNMTIPAWPVEAIVVLFSPARRIGDLIAGTQTVVGIKRPLMSIFTDLRGQRPNRITVLTLLTTFIYTVLLWMLMDNILP